ncbi:MAG: hypothetical protein LPJ89_02935 [Hymenobacteraceae bacterium]|nr:hypothetical protein [Hymenobacteraceae bacterium]MDX5396508.1 hypothetical protein [Hymenobacteraceae bacterium]MDX5442720.1 hypothetical protein [Hymenobacteraceae bacterium]MDX5512575.1 hypothetical protein [Hymenobacteraceae bacterium]
MYISFDQLPDTARIWIYQSDRRLTADEEEQIQLKLRQFVQEWSAHGSALQASAEILRGQFLVLATDESASQPSGCSIDASVRFIRELEQEYNLNLTDRSQLAFLLDNRIKLMSVAEVKNQIKQGNITPDVLYFDNLVPTVGELKTNWVKPASTSWLSKYF